jgi:hypothetical protein
MSGGRLKQLVRNTGARGYRFKQAHEKASRRRKEASDKPRKMPPDLVELLDAPPPAPGPGHRLPEIGVEVIERPPCQVHPSRRYGLILGAEPLEDGGELARPRGRSGISRSNPVKSASIAASCEWSWPLSPRLRVAHEQRRIEPDRSATSFDHA